MKGTYMANCFLKKNKNKNPSHCRFPLIKKCNSTYLITITKNCLTCWLCRVTIDINSGSTISQNFSNFYIYIIMDKNFNRELLNWQQLLLKQCNWPTAPDRPADNIFHAKMALRYKTSKHDSMNSILHVFLYIKKRNYEHIFGHILLTILFRF